MKVNAHKAFMPENFLAELQKKLAMKKPRKAKKARAKKPMADAFGISGKGKPVSKVNKRGTAKAKRQSKAKSPRRVATMAAPPAKRSSPFDSNFFR